MDLKESVMGLEFGSTRIKAVLIDRQHRVLAQGSHRWENRLENGVWTYSLEDILSGMQRCYAALKADFEAKYAQELTELGALGVSAMMHGYLPLDEDRVPLTAFRTWRNTMTEEAARELTELFAFRIPQRWTVAHLYQAILNGEEHLPRVKSLATLASYVHLLLSGVFAAGTGEASGIVPLDLKSLAYDPEMLRRFDARTAGRQLPWRLGELLPQIVPASRAAGRLSAEGARLLDPTGTLRPGALMAPCEGDADTGLVATNCLRKGCCSVSAGTSCFAMLVADRPLGVHPEVDLFCTPGGRLTAMVHSSNCSTELNAWVSLFSELSALLGRSMRPEELYPLLFPKALEGAEDSGGLLSFGLHSGESVFALNEGRPLLLRRPESPLRLSDFMRCQLMSALSSLAIGLSALEAEEGLRAERVIAQGGLFKTPLVAQRLLSAALRAPVSVMESAGEGGAYGMALLGAYLLWKAPGEGLEEYLDRRAFSVARLNTVSADEAERRGFERYTERLKKALPVEKAAIEHI